MQKNEENFAKGTACESWIRGALLLALLFMVRSAQAAPAVFRTPDECASLKSSLTQTETIFRKNQLNAELLADYEREKKNLLDETWWGRTEASAIPEAVHLLTEKTRLVIGWLDPAAASAISKATNAADAAVYALKQGKGPRAAVVAALFKLIPGSQNNVVQGAKLVKLHADGINSLVDNQKNREQLRRDVQAAVARIDAAVGKFAIDLISVPKYEEVLEQVKRSIEAELRTGCGGH